MFIVSVHYQQPLEIIDQHLPAHVSFLERYIADGIFIAAGRKVPRTGGYIFARGVSREVLEGILDEDPFKIHGVATYDVTEFAPNRTAPDFTCLLNL